MYVYTPHSLIFLYNTVTKIIENTFGFHHGNVFTWSIAHCTCALNQTEKDDWNSRIQEYKSKGLWQVGEMVRNKQNEVFWVQGHTSEKTKKTMNSTNAESRAHSHWQADRESETGSCIGLVGWGKVMAPVRPLQGTVSSPRQPNLGSNPDPGSEWDGTRLLMKSRGGGTF